MAEVIFTTTKYSPTHYIDVSTPYSYVRKGGTLVFANKLDGGATVRVSFYSDLLKKQPVDQLCRIEKPGGGYEVVDVVDVTSANPVTCTLMKGDVGEYFSYAAETLPGDALFHKALDPVIIIQPTYVRGDDAAPGSKQLTTYLLGGLIIGILLSYLASLLLRE